MISIKNIDLIIDKKSPIYEKLNFDYIMRIEEDKKEILINNQSLIKTPIVRDCETKKCTVGNSEQIWKSWIK